MQQNYQDAMAIVAKYGKPDLFVTYTCNPKIKDITSEMESVLRIVLTWCQGSEILKDIKDRHILGVPVSSRREACHIATC